MNLLIRSVNTLLLFTAIESKGSLLPPRNVSMSRSEIVQLCRQPYVLSNGVSDKKSRST